MKLRLPGRPRTRTAEDEQAFTMPIREEVGHGAFRL